VTLSVDHCGKGLHNVLCSSVLTLPDSLLTVREEESIMRMTRSRGKSHVVTLFGGLRSIEVEMSRCRDVEKSNEFVYASAPMIRIRHEHTTLI
jgi:hypothetical protein